MALTHAFEPAPRAQLARWAGWYFLANAGVLLLLSLRYFSAASLSGGVFSRIFSILAATGHFASFALIGVAVTLPLIFLMPRKGVVFAFAQVFMALVLLAVIIDTFVFAQYRYHLNGMVLDLLLGGAALEIFTFSGVVWLLFVLLLLGSLSMQWWLGQRLWSWTQRTPRNNYGYIAAALLASVFATENVVYAWADASAYTPITKQIRILPGYAPLTAKKFFDRFGLSSAPDPMAALNLEHASELVYPAHALQCSAPAAPFNILFVLIDAWRFDALTPEVTPNIYKLADSSWRFENHFSGANSTRTGVFSLMYGMPGTYWHAMLAEQRGAVLIEQLVHDNYRMGIFGSAKLTSPEFDRTVFAPVKNLRTQSQGGSPSARDQNITDEFRAFLAQPGGEQQPFFGFLFYDSPHGYDFPANYPLPFTPSWSQVNYLALNNDSDPVPFANRYKNSVHYTDSLIGQVLDTLRARHLFETTIIVVTGDHGQEFNDNKLNYWGHNSNFSRYQTQVPLLIRWPGQGAQRYTHRTSHFDVAPTLLHDALGCTNPTHDYSSGMRLTEVDEQRLLILSSYEQFALAEPTRTAIIDGFGSMEVVDEHYRPSSEKLAPPRLAQAMDEMARFYKR